MRKIVLFSILLITAYISNAQQFPQISHNMFNMMSINPGFAGSSGEVRATLISRQQWVGLEGAPITNLVSADAALKLFGIRSGIGLNLMQDELGFNNDFYLNAAYAYRTNIGQGTLGVGIGLGIANMSLSPEWVIPEGSSFTPAESDPSIPDESTKMGLDLNAGLYYYTKNYYFGLSTTHVSETDFQLEKGTPSLERHYFLAGGATIPLSNPKLELSPSGFIKFDGTAAQYSVAGIVTYNKKFWGGFTYRLGDAIIAMAGAKLITGLKLGLAYDLSINKLGAYNNGSFEVMVNYQFNLEFGKEPEYSKSVRFL